MRLVPGEPTTTIVIVEDERAIADALAVRLRADGLTVAVTPDGPRGGRLCARLPQDVWGYRDGSTGGRPVDSHLAAVRRKLGADVLRTAQGIGYAFRAPGAPTP